MDVEKYIDKYKISSLEVLETLPNKAIAELINILASVRRGQHQIFLCGNGGSAASASHLANDLGKGASVGQPSRFRVLSLTDNLSWITSLANDSSYDLIFLEQLKNYAQPKDLLLAFSGSGNSPNVLEAMKWANLNGLVTVGITGSSGGQLSKYAKHVIAVNSSHMGHIEEAHFLILHLLSYYFMETSNH